MSEKILGNIWRQLGRVAFWLSWPLLWFYLRRGSRTRVVVEAEGKILLVQSWLGNNQWGLPGGGLHSHEDPADGAVRELLEETRLKVDAWQLKQLYKDEANQYGLIFRYHCFWASITEPTPLIKQKYEITKLAWVPIAETGKMRLTRDCRQALAAWTKSQSLLK